MPAEPKDLSGKFYISWKYIMIIVVGTNNIEERLHEAADDIDFNIFPKMVLLFRKCRHISTGDKYFNSSFIMHS